MRYFLAIMLLGLVLVLAACSSQAEPALSLQAEELSALASASGATIAFYQGIPEDGGTLVSKFSFTKDKTQESRQALFSAREAAIEAGADYVAMTNGEKQVVKPISELGKFGRRGHFRNAVKNNMKNGVRGNFKQGAARNSEAITFYKGLTDGAEITVELFTADPSLTSTATPVASFTITKGNKSRQNRATQMAELKSTLEAANVSFKDITHKRLSSEGQSIVTENKQRRGSKRGFRRGASTP